MFCVGPINTSSWNQRRNLYSQKILLDAFCHGKWVAIFILLQCQNIQLQNKISWVISFGIRRKTVKLCKLAINHEYLRLVLNLWLLTVQLTGWDWPLNTLVRSMVASSALIYRIIFVLRSKICHFRAKYYRKIILIDYPLSKLSLEDSHIIVTLWIRPLNL